MGAIPERTIEFEIKDGGETVGHVVCRIAPISTRMILDVVAQLDSKEPGSAFEAMRLFDPVLISWDLTDAAGTPLELTTFSLPLPYAMQLAVTWMLEAQMGTPAPFVGIFNSTEPSEPSTEPSPSPESS
jgi:hypothetical protein